MTIVMIIGIVFGQNTGIKRVKTYVVVIDGDNSFERLTITSITSLQINSSEHSESAIIVED